MIRNSYPNELIIYGTVICRLALFGPALVYHFTCSYLNQPRVKTTVLIWAVCIIACIGNPLDIMGPIVSISNYSWGNLFQFKSALIIAGFSIWVSFYYFFVSYSCWLLYRAHSQESSALARHHILYILIGFLANLITQVKLITLIGVDTPYLLPIGTFLHDIFSALIGIAIIKHRLFDITVIIRKTTIYSAFVALIIFIFSFSEHMLATYVGELLREHSVLIHLISIAVVIAILMPVRQRLERTIERFFAKKKVEF
jgi:hypothetical protein